MNEFKLKLPDTVEVDGSFYPINTNFSTWITFSNLIQNKETVLGDLDFIYLGTPPKDRITGFKALYDFYAPYVEIPRSSGKNSNVKILDYVIDFDLIYSAFLQQYKIDLYEENLRLHWHKFTALLSGLKDTRLNEIMEIRAYTGKDKELLKLKSRWALPVSKELTQATKDFNALFSK